MTATSITRIAVFIDGTYFGIVNDYYRSIHPIATHLDYPKFLTYLRERVAEIVRKDIHTTTLSDVRMYIGLPNKTTPDQIKWKRKMLAQAGVSLHAFPLETLPNGRVKERGVDVGLAVDAALTLDRYDVFILVSGDGDFIPLVESLRQHKKVVVVPFWNITPQGRSDFVSIMTNSELLLAADFTISLGSIIRKGVKKKLPEILALFGIDSPRTEPTRFKKPLLPLAPAKQSVTPKLIGISATQRGRIVEKREAVGYIRPATQLDQRKIPFMKWNSGNDTTNFETVAVGQDVEYEVYISTPRSKGIAVNLRVVTETKMPPS